MSPTEDGAAWPGVLAGWPERLCVAVLVTDPEGRVALVASAKPGRAYEIPGGGVKPGEEPIDAAIREVAEEIGVRLVREDLEQAGILPGTPKPGAMYTSRIHVYRARAEGELRAGSDAVDARWFTAEEVLLMAAGAVHQGRGLSDLESRDRVLLPWARLAVQPEPECTGLTAVWCPVHGECTCPFEDDNPDNGRTLDDPACPLHAATSPHGTEDDEPGACPECHSDPCKLDCSRRPDKQVRLSMRLPEGVR